MINSLLRSTAILGVFGILFSNPGFCVIDGVEENLPETSTLQTLGPKEIELRELQDQQIAKVGEFLRNLPQNTQARLILGSTNILPLTPEDEARSNFFSTGSWVFFDDLPHDPNGLPHIQGNFNELDIFERMVAAFPSSFRQILVDDSTFKFTAWNKQHILLLTKLLASEGELVYCPEMQFTGIDGTKELSEKNEILEYIRNTLLSSPDDLPHPQLQFPIIGAAPEDYKTYEARIAPTLKEYEKLKPYTELERNAFFEKVDELCPSLTTVYPPHVVGNDALLKKYLIEDEKTWEVRKDAFREVLLPLSKEFLEKFFETVVIEEHVLFPVPSRHDNGGSHRTIIHAKKPIRN